MTTERTDLIPDKPKHRKLIPPTANLSWPIGYVCPECGSTEISFEAFVYWSPELQEFYCDDLCDKGHYCGPCSSEIHPDQVYICRSCHRPEQDCSESPCAAVQADRT